jgi:hypothetical protein
MSVAPGLGWWVRRWAQLALTRVRWAKNDAKATLSGLIHKHGEALDLPARSPDPRA